MTSERHHRRSPRGNGAGRDRAPGIGLVLLCGAVLSIAATAGCIDVTTVYEVDSGPGYTGDDAGAEAEAGDAETEGGTHDAARDAAKADSR